MTRVLTHGVEWLRRHFLWLFPLATAALVAFVGLWGQARVREALQFQVRGDLETTLNANVTALEIWVADQKRLASTLASDPELLPLARELLAGATNSGATDFQDRAALTFRFNEAMGRRLAGTGYKVGQLVDTRLGILSDSGRRRTPPGMTVPDSLQPKFMELMKSGQPVMITPFKPPRPSRPPRGRGDSPPGFRGFGPPRAPGEGVPGQPGPANGRRGDPAMRPGFPDGLPGRPGQTNRPGSNPLREVSALMQVAAPVRDTSGLVVGAIGLILDPEEEFTRILSVARPGETGETYAFDRNGVLISRSRFEGELRRLALINPEGRGGSALVLELREPGSDFRPGTRPGPASTNWPLTRLVSNAIDGSPGVSLEASRDYRGVAVVGTWRWLNHLGFGVVTQLDEAEAFQPARQLQRVFLVLFLLLVLAAVGLLWISNAGIHWRQRLSEAELRARRLGQYTLMEKIGEGGMGVVYKARHALMRRDTAVKLLLPEYADDATIARFEKEVQLTCRLKHPSTIQVYDYGRTFDGIFYYAMEYLEGLTLQRLVDEFGPLPGSRVVHILIQVCDSLAEAHSLGLVHRDIKPANIFLCCQGGVTDLVKVLDFGLVAGVPGADPAGGVEPDRHAGTPQFMAPEAFNAGVVPDPRMDIYAVGATGYFLLTGREVFDGPTLDELKRQHESEAPRKPSARSNLTLDAGLETLILECLEKDPAHRPASATILATHLRQLRTHLTWARQDSASWWEGHDTGIRSGSTASLTPSPTSSVPTPTLLIPAVSDPRSCLPTDPG